MAWKGGVTKGSKYMWSYDHKQRNPSKMCVSKICQKCASKKLRQKYARSIKLQRHPDSLRWRSNSLMIWFSVKPKEWSLEKGWHPPSSANSVIILAAIWEELFVLELIRYHVSNIQQIILSFLWQMLFRVTSILFGSCSLTMYCGVFSLQCRSLPNVARRCYLWPLCLIRHYQSWPKINLGLEFSFSVPDLEMTPVIWHKQWLLAIILVRFCGGRFGSPNCGQFRNR